MDGSFAHIAESLHDLAREERQWIAFLRHMALIGQVEPPPDTDFAGWRVRLGRLEEAAALLTALIPHEAAVRALDQDAPGR